MTPCIEGDCMYTYCTSQMQIFVQPPLIWAYGLIKKLSDFSLLTPFPSSFSLPSPFFLSLSTPPHPLTPQVHLCFPFSLLFLSQMQGLQNPLGRHPHWFYGCRKPLTQLKERVKNCNHCDRECATPEIKLLLPQRSLPLDYTVWKPWWWLTGHDFSIWKNMNCLSLGSPHW